MAQNYSKRMAVDVGQGVMQDPALPLKALVSRTSENAAVSSVVTLNDNCTNLEIAAVGAPVFIRWVPRSDTQGSVIGVAGATANYDNVVPAGTYRKFVVPIETIGTSSIVGANIANGLYNRIAYISGSAGSVLTTQY